MTTINELESLQNNITGFYANFIRKKRQNKKDLINLYIKDKLARIILLNNLNEEYKNCKYAYNFLVSTLSYENKKDIISAIKENKKEYPEIYDGVMMGFKILIKMKYDVEKLFNVLEREIAYIDNKQQLEKIYKNEEIPLLIKIDEKNKIWNSEYNSCASRLKKNKDLLNIKSQAGGAARGALGMVIAFASGIITYHQIRSPGVDFGSDFLFILETMARDGILFGIIATTSFILSISSFKREEE